MALEWRQAVPEDSFGEAVRKAATPDGGTLYVDECDEEGFMLTWFPPDQEGLYQPHYANGFYVKGSILDAQEKAEEWLARGCEPAEWPLGRWNGKGETICTVGALRVQREDGRLVIHEKRNETSIGIELSAESARRVAYALLGWLKVVPVDAAPVSSAPAGEPDLEF